MQVVNIPDNLISLERFFEHCLWGTIEKRLREQSLTSKEYVFIDFSLERLFSTMVHKEWPKDVVLGNANRREL